MPLIDSTFILDHKATLEKNMSMDNHYLKSLQQKINREWYYKANIVDIEEEKIKQMEYTTEYPVYTPIEVEPGKVKTETGETLGADWIKLRFKDIKYDSWLGKRYRFSHDFEKFNKLTEEEKRVEASIWITFNLNSIDATNAVVARRCNSNIGFVGSPTMDYNNITEIHYEPCILESNVNNISFYYNKVLSLPQSEIYAIMQYNFFTQNIKTNDRFLIGDTDILTESNNTVFSVKGISRFSSYSTFKINTNLDVGDIPLVLIALGRDTILKNEDLVHRIAEGTTIYRVPSDIVPIKDESFIKITPLYDYCISINETKVYSADVFINESPQNKNIVFTCDLENTTRDSLYYSYTVVDNQISIKNLKTYQNGKLKITARWEDIEESIYVELGGY